VLRGSDRVSSLTEQNNPPGFRSFDSVAIPIQTILPGCSWYFYGAISSHCLNLTFKLFCTTTICSGLSQHSLISCLNQLSKPFLLLDVVEVVSERLSQSHSTIAAIKFSQLLGIFQRSLISENLEWPSCLSISHPQAQYLLH
jgi:hypothetical protein